MVEFGQQLKNDDSRQWRQILIVSIAIDMMAANFRRWKNCYPLERRLDEFETKTA